MNDKSSEGKCPASVSMFLLVVMIAMLSSPACIDTRKWVLIEIADQDGIIVHQRGEFEYAVGGAPHRADEYGWKPPSTAPPAWVLEAYGAREVVRVGDPMWPSVLSGDLSRNGLLALARGRHHPTGAGRDTNRHPWITEILDFSTGRAVAVLDNNPLAVAWSNDGSALAILTVKDLEGGQDEEYLELWNEDVGIISTWPVQFDPYAEHYTTYQNNRFAISWSSDDRYIVVSTRKIPRNGMASKFTIVSAQDGPLVSDAASDAHFVGADLIVANYAETWNEVWLIQITAENALKKKQRVWGERVIATSDPETGTYVAWRPPPIWPPKAFSFPLSFYDLHGHSSISFTGFRTRSTLRLMDTEGYEEAKRASVERAHGNLAERKLLQKHTQR